MPEQNDPTNDLDYLDMARYNENNIMKLNRSMACLR